MGKSSKTPDAPDLLGLEKLQAADQLNLARYNTGANRINQFTPFGSMVYSHGSGADKDKWTSTVKLDPAQQKILNQQNALTTTLGTQAGKVLAKPFDLNGLPARQINAGQTAQDALLSRLEPQFARDEESLRSRLVNQGIAPGSNAERGQIDQFNQGRTDARLQAALQGMDIGERERAAAFGENSYLRNEPLNMLSVLKSGGQVGMPNFSQPGQQQLTNAADLTGAAQGNYTNQLGNYNAKQAQSNSTTQGLLTVAGIAAMAF